MQLTIVRNATPDYAPEYTLYDDSSEERKATVHGTLNYAALLASASDLLAVLKPLLGIVEFEFENDPESDDLPSWKRAINDAREAIANIERWGDPN